MTPGSKPRGAPGTWRLSLTASLALHAGVVGALLVSLPPSGPEGGERRATARLIFELFRELPEELPEPPPEVEPDLQVALLEEPIEVRPVAYEPEPIPPEMPLERVELLPRPTDEIRPEDMTPPQPEPVPEPDPIPAPAPPVDPPVEASAERVEPAEDTVGEAEADEAVPAPLADACPDPPYPQRAVLRRLQGEVECLITVGADGRVVGVVVVKSSGHAVLDRAAREGLLVWRFRPGTRAGVPVEMDVLKTIIFRVP